MKVGIVGAGNVATHLVKGLAKAGVEVPVIYSRTVASAEVLAMEATGAIATNSPDFKALPFCDVYLLAVPDQALPELLQTLSFPEGTIVAHTSGTQPLELLVNLAGVQTGVFYPLQTFSKEKELDWRQIPICVEASSQRVEDTLLELGKILSEQVVLMKGEDRKKLHVAAVFACNFTNHLWGVAQELLKKAELPVSLLEPLVQETVQKAFQFPPFSVQTGPAVRKDANTIQAHAQLLQEEPHYLKLYQTLTESIQAVQENPTFSGKQA
ncbi:Rossmann-like and DUF2520 domain-containing protein [Rufibacter latericius]|uniref:DUF2520 domain-containing protein n=1 Tax=Rufibacter latericius TaxID=2487040 RepID=A0A3M9MNG0_9BACT|nr:Rossmann-like and DUF2520 domain-containing protein [Rufibacter latericius]RNI26218.1 DUF2520 domain-containing protein [Rufibacter latericius]